MTGQLRSIKGLDLSRRECSTRLFGRGEVGGGSPHERSKTKNLRVALPRGNAEDLNGNRSLDARSSRATDPLFLAGRKHIAEGAGFGSNPSWLPLHKTKK